MIEEKNKDRYIWQKDDIVIEKERINPTNESKVNKEFNGKKPNKKKMGELAA